MRMRGRDLSLAAVAIASAALALTTYATSSLTALDRNTVDARFSIRGRESAPKNFVIVAIDKRTLNGLSFQWPYPRRVHAQVIDRIAAEHPAAIAYDVQFSDPGVSQKDDLALLNAINNAGGRTVVAETATIAPGKVPFLGSSQGTALLHAVGSRPGETLLPLDSGGVVRQMSYSVDGLESFAVAAAEVATHRHITPAQFAGGADWIDYVGPGGTFPSVSFLEVYRANRLPSDYFRGKIVVIGPTDPSLQDIHASSTDPKMSGAEIQANAIETVLRGNPLASAPGWLNVVLIVLLATAVPLASLRAGAALTGVVAVSLGVLFLIAAQLAFDAGRVLAVVYPLIGLVACSFGTLTHKLHYMAIDTQLERLRTVVARAASARIVAAGDAERRRIERDLHDGAQQRLVSLSLVLRLLSNRLDLDQHGDPAVRDLALQASAELNEAINQLRELARGIHPPILTDEGLGPALEALAEQAHLPVALRLALPVRPPAQVEAAAYFACAEALTNCVKHAHAKTVEISANEHDHVLHVEIRDDGVGGAKPGSGTGLRGLIDRVEAVEGTLAIRSPPGGGTRIIADIPWTAVPHEDAAKIRDNPVASASPTWQG